MKEIKNKILAENTPYNGWQTSFDSLNLTNQLLSIVLNLNVLVMQDSVVSIQKPTIKINREATIREEKDQEISSKTKISEKGISSSKGNWIS